jgi:hypothetical protein
VSTLRWPRGGIGRRTGFRFLRSQGHSGSTPDGATKTAENAALRVNLPALIHKTITVIARGSRSMVAGRLSVRVIAYNGHLEETMSSATGWFSSDYAFPAGSVIEEIRRFAS